MVEDFLPLRLDLLVLALILNSQQIIHYSTVVIRVVVTEWI